MITLVGDTEIAFDDIGSGMPLVFLHAFPLNRTMWEPQVSALVAESRCIPIDYRGFGGSPPQQRIVSVANSVPAAIRAMRHPFGALMPGMIPQHAQRMSNGDASHQ